MQRMIDWLVWRWVWWREDRYQRREVHYHMRKRRDHEATMAYYESLKD